MGAGNAEREETKENIMTFHGPACKGHITVLVTQPSLTL